MSAYQWNVARVPRVVITLGVFCISILVWGWLVSPDERTREHLGAEYFNIGRAIADGRGFSDPFAEPTGPTAWMPPVYPLLLALLLEVSGSRAAVAFIIQALMAASYVLVGALLHSEARRRCEHISPRVAVASYVMWLFLFQYWFFHLTTDIWLISAVLFLTCLLCIRQKRGDELRGPWRWGLLGGAAAVISPAVFSAWVVMLGLSFPWRGPGPRRRAWAGALLLALAMAAPWTIRNAAHFGKFIPTKSNLLFELHQANVLDDDGVYDLKTMNRHPYNELQARHNYARLGETAYIQQHGQSFFEEVKKAPADLAGRIEQRAMAALLLYEPLLPDEREPLELAIKRIVYIAPLVALLIALSIRGPGREPLARLGALWAAYLLPYILIAYYVRYAFPLVPLLCLGMTLSLDRIFGALNRLPQQGSGQSVDEGMMGGEAPRGRWERRIARKSHDHTPL